MKIALVIDTFDELNGVARTYHRFAEFCREKNISLTIFTNFLFPITYLPKLHLYYLKAGLLFTIYIVIWSSIVGKSFYELYKYIRSSSGIANIQGKYLFLAMLLRVFYPREGKNEHQDP